MEVYGLIYTIYSKNIVLKQTQNFWMVGNKYFFMKIIKIKKFA